MKISAEVFGAYLNCPTKCWLRAAGHPPTGNAYSEWVKAQNDSYRGPHAKVGHDEVLPGRRLQLLVELSRFAAGYVVVCFHREKE